MGMGETPPPNVPTFLVPLSAHMLEAAGALWIIVYIRFMRSAKRDKTYGIPIACLASNMACDIVAGAYVTEDPTERYGYCVLAFIVLGLIYYTVKYGPNEWNHAPVIQRNIFAVITILFCVFASLQYSFARYWIDNKLGSERGRSYRGVTPAADIKELAFWTGQASAAGLNVLFVAQLLVRWDNRGHDWMTWVLRVFGTVAGIYGYWTLRWWYWPEMHPYVANPFAVCLVVIGFGCDLLYGVLMFMIDRSPTEKPWPSKTKN